MAACGVLLAVPRLLAAGLYPWCGAAVARGPVDVVGCADWVPDPHGGACYMRCVVVIEVDVSIGRYWGRILVDKCCGAGKGDRR